MRTRSSDTAVFTAAAVVYLVAGTVVAFDGVFFGDALSRVQSAAAVLFSRTPALVDIGFVFTPLSTLLELPLVALTPWIPAMSDRALAGVIVSALFMAGAVLQVWRTGADRGLRTSLQVVLTVIFAVNPMVVLYGANGMSEAPFLFAVAWATRRLMRFCRTDDVHDLTAAGIAVALSFLARYDGLVSAAVAGVFVGTVTYLRTRGDRRLARAVTDVVVFTFPVGVAVLVWFGTSWLTTGTLSVQTSGVYGNAAILEASGATGSGVPAATDSLVRILMLAPGLPVLVAVVALLGHRRRSPEMWVPVAVLGAVLVFQVLTAVTGATFGLLRFFLVALLLATVLGMLVPDPVGEVVPRRPGLRPTARGDHPLTGHPVLAATGVVVLALTGTVTTAWGMTSRTYAPQEYALAAATPLASGMDAKDLEDRRAVLRTWGTERQIAGYLDSRDLPEGSVLLDVAFGFPVVLFSRDPSVFTVPSDPDFVTSLDDLWNSGVRYVLTVPPEGRGAQDAVNLRYPTIWEDGAGVATLELDVPNDGVGQPDFRLYRVRENPRG